MPTGDRTQIYTHTHGTKIEKKKKINRKKESSWLLLVLLLLPFDWNIGSSSSLLCKSTKCNPFQCDHFNAIEIDIVQSPRNNTIDTAEKRIICSGIQAH